jgi:hypothetical protein
MPGVSDQLSGIQEKTSRLIELCSALQEENDLLRLENESMKAAVHSGKLQAADLQEKLNALKMARSLEGMEIKHVVPNEKTFDIKQKINEFVREIDRCIVLLKR